MATARHWKAIAAFNIGPGFQQDYISLTEPQTLSLPGGNRPS
jgi:hypothetical protein